MKAKVLLLCLMLVALTGLAATQIDAASLAGPSHACRFCSTPSSGTLCCRSCTCNAAGIPVACTNVVCSPQ